MKVVNGWPQRSDEGTFEACRRVGGGNEVSEREVGGRRVGVGDEATRGCATKAGGNNMRGGYLEDAAGDWGRRASQWGDGRAKYILRVSRSQGSAITVGERVGGSRVPPPPWARVKAGVENGPRGGRMRLRGWLTGWERARRERCPMTSRTFSASLFSTCTTTGASPPSSDMPGGAPR